MNSILMSSIGPEAGEQDQVPGQIDDLDRLAHVEDEDLAAVAHGRGLQDQLARLRGWS